MSRTQFLAEFLADKSVDALLLSSPISITYYTGFSSFSTHEREGYALVTKHDAFLLTSPLYEGALKSIPDITPVIYSAKHPFSKTLEVELAKHKIRKLGVEENNLTLSEYRTIKKIVKKIVPLTIRHLRMKKTKEEIVAIQKACKIADNAFAQVKKQIKLGMSERHIGMLLEDAIRSQDAKISFRPIVAFSENAAIPHHLSSDKRLKTNDLILVDFGAKWHGYCSDMTRTFFFGKPTAEQQKVYETVLDAQKAAVDFLNSYFILHNSKPKTILAYKIDNAARNYITSQGYPSIPHSLGHGIGLEIHEPPSLGLNSKDILEDGMVFSIEPGIYLPEQFGVRIEDLFAIQNGKLLQLTTAPKL